MLREFTSWELLVMWQKTFFSEPSGSVTKPEHGCLVDHVAYNKIRQLIRKGYCEITDADSLIFWENFVQYLTEREAETIAEE
jgi:hypothetical protein